MNTDAIKSYTMITGATGGLGKAFAVECASRGWNLYLTDLRAEALDTLAASLHNTYAVDVQWRVCDLTDDGQRRALFTALAASGLRFANLVNVAGGDVEGLFAEQCAEDMRRVLRLNVEAAMETTSAVLGLRDASSALHIINVASLAAFYPMPYKATYAASKRFLLDFSLALGEELRAQGVTVTAVCPAGMPTTQACVEAIEAQGLMGQLTTANTGSVAAGAIDAALSGHAVYIPGALNRLLYSLGRLVPATWVARLVARRWSAAHRRRERAAPARGSTVAPQAV